MNNITITRDSKQGFLYYSLNGKFTQLNILQGNLFKIYDKDFDGSIISNTPELQFYEIKTQDGARTFMLSGPSTRTVMRGGGGGGSSSSSVGGSGTLNYIAKFTPDGTHIGDSLLYDNGVSVGFGTTTPNASAAIDITSTSQGFLTARMTTVQRNAIAAPTDGLLVYNTTTKLFSYWDSGAATWQNIDSQAGGDVSGSGTTNFVMKWTDGPNSVAGNSILFDDGTNVGIGINPANSKLQVAGAIRTGVASSINGSLIFQNSTNANILTINAAVFGANITWTLPTAQGGANTVLTNDGTGVLSWGAAITADWQLDGNTVGSEKWIGTIDNFAFPFRTNNTEKMRLTTGGFLGINTNNPQALIHGIGTGNTSATSSFRIDSSTVNSIFEIKNDGYISAGLSNGSMTIGYNSKFPSAYAGNTIIGINISEFATYTGTYNTHLGFNAGHDLSSGQQNVFVGRNAGVGVSTGSYNVIIGEQAGASNSSNRIIIGQAAGALSDNGSIAIGYAAMGGIGTGCTIIGYNSFSIYNVTGTLNTSVGYSSMQRVTSGSRNAYFGTETGTYSMAGASDNVFLGYQAGFTNNDTGDITGTLARSSNTFIGSGAGKTNRGNNGVSIGYYAGFYETANNKVFIDAIDRGSEANGRNLSLIYGKTDAAVANQFVVLNGVLYMQDTAAPNHYWSIVNTGGVFVFTDTGSANAPA